MNQRPLCPICGKRRAERFCPAKGERICAVCCGIEREVTLDCPSDCAYLIAAHRYEQEHRPPLTPADLPFPNVEVSSHLIYERQAVIEGLSRTILSFAAGRRDLADGDALAALLALAETYRTLSSGIYYARPPDAPVAHGLYAALEELLQNYKKEESLRAMGLAALKDGDVFQALVFLARVARSHTNGRPRSRMFLDFLAAQFPAPPAAAPAEASRIIIP
jgi:hypothetical protein